MFKKISLLSILGLVSCGGSSEGSNKARKESVPVSNKSLVYLGNGESKEVESLKQNDNLKFVRSLQLIPYKRSPLTGESLLAKGLATVVHYY